MITMKITKGNWTTDGDTFAVSMPMSKIDKENRLVSGWASLDNPDLQGDIVTQEASEKAFAKFRGNIREMHQNIAVGRMVSYKPDSYYDEVTKRFYNGIFVTAYVSKGAQDTWEKVLDGTLSAFSIKGPIIDSDMEFSKDAGRPLRIVKDYGLEELSLVDSGGNQLANVVSVMKVNGETVVTGMVTDTQSENVFYCDKHDSAVAKTSTEESIECLEGHKMTNIGWIEYDDSNKAAKVDEVIAKHNSTTNNAKQELPATNEGGVDVADTVETEVVATDTAPVVDTNKVEGGTVEVANNAEVEVPVAEEVAPVEAAPAPEVEVEKPADFAQMLEALTASIATNLEQTSAKTTEALATVTQKFEAQVAELTNKFDSIQSELVGVQKSLAAVESETAVKKSGDLGGSPEETLVKSNGSKRPSWSGAFLGIQDDE